jgi:hypothetical protein
MNFFVTGPGNRDYIKMGADDRMRRIVCNEGILTYC